MSGPERVLAIFFFNLIFVIALYLFLGRFKVPTSKEPSGKITPYASDEDLPPVKVQFYPQNFFYAVYFTIFNVTAFIVATSIF